MYLHFCLLANLTLGSPDCILQVRIFNLLIYCTSHLKTVVIYSLASQFVKVKMQRNMVPFSLDNS